MGETIIFVISIERPHRIVCRCTKKLKRAAGANRAQGVSRGLYFFVVKNGCHCQSSISPPISIRMDSVDELSVTSKVWLMPGLKLKVPSTR